MEERLFLARNVDPGVQVRSFRSNPTPAEYCDDGDECSPVGRTHSLRIASLFEQPRDNLCVSRQSHVTPLGSIMQKAVH